MELELIFIVFTGTEACFRVCRFMKTMQNLACYLTA